jgi:hypothetical protein
LLCHFVLLCFNFKFFFFGFFRKFL